VWLDTSAFTHGCHMVACVLHLQVNMDSHRKNQRSPSGSWKDTEGERNTIPVNCFTSPSKAPFMWVAPSETCRKLPRVLEVGLGLVLRLVAPGNLRASKNPAEHFSLNSQLLLLKMLLWKLQPGMSNHLSRCTESVFLKWENDPSISDITAKSLIQFQIY